MARRTVQRYIDLMRHGLGKTPKATHLIIEDLNDAGRFLFRAAESAPHFHSWSWLTADNVDFTIPGGSVTTIKLPKDFGQFIDLHFENTFVGQVVPTTPAQLNLLRRSIVTDPMTSYITFDVGASQPTADSEPGKYASFWPPREEETTGLKLVYRRSWVDIDVKEDGEADDANAVPDFPQEYERLFVMICRAYAIEIEDQAEAFESGAVERELKQLVASDAGKQVIYNRATHSVMGRARSWGARDPWYGRRVVKT